jgi:hypothetical protein
MTRRTRTLFLLALLLGTIGWAGIATTAYAGGPTSVLMTNPGAGRASALYFADPDYDRLRAAVGDSATGDPAPPSGVRSGEEEVRLTWLIHDMRIWRIDRVHLTRQDGIWVETVVEPNGDGDVFDRPSRWHRANDEQTLTLLLASAGLVSVDSTPSDPSNPNDPSRVTAASSPPSPAVVPIVAAAAGGLVIGAVGSLLLRRRPAVDRPRVTLSG